MIRWALLAAAVLGSPVRAGSEEATITLTASCLPDGRLDRLVVGDRVVATATTFDDAALPRGLVARIRLAEGGGQPYRCVGGIIFGLQQRGFRKVEVVTE